MSFNFTKPDIYLDRFIEEQEYVVRYTELLQRKLTLSGGEISGIIQTLESYNLIDKSLFPDNTYLYKDSFDSDKAKQVFQNLGNIKPAILSEISETENQIAQTKKPRDLSYVSGGSLAGECITHLFDVFENNPTEEIIQREKKSLLEQLESYEEEPVFITHEKGTFEELVNYCVDATLYLIPVRKAAALQDVYYEIEDVEVAGRLSRSDTEINPLRQGFITITTIFDATVFDLMRVALNRDFFNLISSFGKQEKISLEKIGQFSSFDEFKNEIIEDRLKSKYLKDILSILNSSGISLTNITQGNEYIHLIELVMRRNIHIHNRGIIDSKYLELNESGKPRYNIYDFKLGDIASIDSEYWGKVNQLCLFCVRSISEWIDTLPK